MAIVSLTIIHHNVLHWRTNFLSLSNTYSTIDPDIILINSHGNHSDNKIKIFNYDVIQFNSTGERNDGSAIYVKKGITFQQVEGLSPDALAIRIQIDKNIY